MDRYGFLFLLFYRLNYLLSVFCYLFPELNPIHEEVACHQKNNVISSCITKLMIVFLQFTQDKTRKIIHLCAFCDFCSLSDLSAFFRHFWSY